MKYNQNQWQLQEAKSKLGQLIKEASEGAPQHITVRGRRTAVILSTEEYEPLKNLSSSLSLALLMPILDEDEHLFERTP